MGWSKANQNVEERKPQKGCLRGATAIRFGVAAALTFGVLPIPSWISPGDSIPAKLGREAVWWCFALALLLWLKFAEGRPLSSIGIQRLRWKGAGFAVLLALAVTAVMVVQFAVVIPLFHLNAAAALAERQAILNTPLWYRFVLVLRAAVVEEILFRGYLIEKVRQLSGSTVLAAAVSVAAFTFGHLRAWGPVHLTAAGASGVIFAAYYVWRRDLPSNMLGHFLTDAVGFLA